MEFKRPSPPASDHEPRHTPFRSWALQQGLGPMLGSEPRFGDEADELGLDADDTSTSELRGRAYLRDRLAPNRLVKMRTRTSASLWAAAVATELFNQWGPIGISSTDRSFAITVSIGIFALGFTLLVFPRVSYRSYRYLEQLSFAMAISMIAFKCSESGGAGSPYSVWLLIIVFYAAFFWQPTQLFWNTLATVSIAFAPLIYEPELTSTNDAFFAALLMAIMISMSLAMLYRRQLSRAAESAVKFLSLADPLTGVANLRAFEQFAAELRGNERREHQILPFELVMVDMNGLKGANTVFGFDVGDGMVVRLSRLMMQACDDNAQVARIGGDEFAVLLSRPDSQNAAEWSGRFELLVAGHNERIRGRMPQISVAIGDAAFPADGDTTAQLIAAADDRMYKQKAHAVAPAHMLDDASPNNAGRMMRGGATSIAPLSAFSADERAAQGCSMWALVSLFMLAWPFLPGAEVPHPAATVALASFGFLVAAIAFAARDERYRAASMLITDLSVVVFASFGVWLTGGWESPFQIAGVLVVGYYCQFFLGVPGVTRVLVTLSVYSATFWLSGPVDPAGQTLFVTIISAELVFAALLQLNGLTTEKSLTVVRSSATHDALTGVSNLIAFRSDLDELVDASEAVGDSHARSTALVIADIDRFGNVNLQGGHVGGDAILREAVRRLQTANTTNGKIYRIGGDEFAVLFQVDRISDAAGFAATCRRALSFTPPEHLGLTGTITASVGFSVLRAGTTSEAFVSDVETALAESKSRSGDSIGADTNVML